MRLTRSPAHPVRCIVALSALAAIGCSSSDDSGGSGQPAAALQQGGLYRIPGGQRALQRDQAEEAHPPREHVLWREPGASFELERGAGGHHELRAASPTSQRPTWAHGSTGFCTTSPPT